jgi:pachytene checkpoint protein 2
MDVAETVISNTLLPEPRHQAMWDSIIGCDDVKERLLHWALLSLRLRTSLPFEVSSLHGLLLLYGQPGTGKTTLAKGLGQIVAPLTASGKTRLIELNPHGLMSAEHGQSQRKVTELLTEHLPALADDGLPTIVLLDEVESMAVARSEASLAANPADVHRATVAVLTALDHNAASHPHLLVIATSNFTGALDTAFLSRTDIAIEVPPPDEEAALAILTGSLAEMARVFPDLQRLAQEPGLKAIAGMLAGVSGRQIRKTIIVGMAARRETVINPGLLTLADLMEATSHVARDSDFTSRSLMEE